MSEFSSTSRLERSFHEDTAADVAVLVAITMAMAGAARWLAGSVGGFIEIALGAALVCAAIGAFFLARARLHRAAEIVLMGITIVFTIDDLGRQGLVAGSGLAILDVFLLATVFWGIRGAMVGAAAALVLVFGLLFMASGPGSVQALESVPASLLLGLGIGLFGVARMRSLRVPAHADNFAEARAADRRLAKWHALLRLSRSFLTSSRPHDLAFDTASTLATALQAPMVAVWLRGEDKKLHRRAIVGQQALPDVASDDGIEPSARVGRIERRTEAARIFLGAELTGFLAPIGEELPFRGFVVIEDGPHVLEDDDFELLAAAAGLMASACERVDADDAVRASQRLEVTSELLGGVAHDFNNLITAIASNTDVALAELPPDSEIAECLHDVASAAQHAGVLTGRIRAWARPEPLAPARLDLGAVLRQNVRLLGNLLGKQVQLGIEAPPSGVDVLLDRNDAEQILYNLVLAARNAAQEAPRRVDVRVLHRGETVEIVVIDDGPGQGADARAQLYEAVPTAPRPTSRPSMALATVRRLAERGGGHVTMEGGANATNVLRVTFPRMAPAEAASTTSPPSRRRVRIVLVDDSPPARVAGAKALRSGGHHVIEAEDPREVLETWDPRTDLLVTDIRMRGLSGGELAKALAERGWPGPVLFVTGHPTEVPALIPGRTALLSKPYTRGDMLQAVDALLGAVV